MSGPPANPPPLVFDPIWVSTDPNWCLNLIHERFIEAYINMVPQYAETFVDFASNHQEDLNEDQKVVLGVLKVLKKNPRPSYTPDVEAIDQAIQYIVAKSTRSTIASKLWEAHIRGVSDIIRGIGSFVALQNLPDYTERYQAFLRDLQAHYQPAQRLSRARATTSVAPSIKVQPSTSGTRVVPIRPSTLGPRVALSRPSRSVYTPTEKLQLGKTAAQLTEAGDAKELLRFALSGDPHAVIYVNRNHKLGVSTRDGLLDKNAKKKTDYIVVDDLAAEKLEDFEQLAREAYPTAPALRAAMIENFKMSQATGRTLSPPTKVSPISAIALARQTTPARSVSPKAAAIPTVTIRPSKKVKQASEDEELQEAIRVSLLPEQPPYASAQRKATSPKRAPSPAKATATTFGDVKDWPIPEGPVYGDELYDEESPAEEYHSGEEEIPDSFADMSFSDVDEK